MKWLQKDDFERFIGMMPKSYQAKQIAKLPNLNEDQIEETIKYIEEKNKADPFAVLQKDVFAKWEQYPKDKFISQLLDKLYSFAKRWIRLLSFNRQSLSL